MRILMLANKVPYPPNDGGAFATLNMAVGLAESGAKVTMLAMSTPKHPSTENDFPKDIRDKIDVKTVFVNTNLSPLKALANLIFSKHAYNAQRFISSQFARAIQHTLLQDKYDIVQLEGLYLYPYVDLIRKHFAGKIALRAHNVEHEIWERSALVQQSPLKKWYFTLLSKRIEKAEVSLLQSVDILVPISLRDEQMLKQLGFEGASLASPTGFCIGNAVEVSNNFEFPSLFHLGSLDWIPNQEGIFWFLDNCWPHVLSSVPNAKFYLAGRNAPKHLIEKVADYTNVVYVGEVENSANFMQSKAVMVVPLLSGSGMRIKIVEGMALGKAIVTTTIGAEGIAVEDGKHLAIADTPLHFAKRVVELLLSKEETMRIGNESKLYANHNLNNSILTRKLFDFYNK